VKRLVVNDRNDTDKCKKAPLTWVRLVVSSALQSTYGNGNWVDGSVQFMALSSNGPMNPVITFISLLYISESRYLSAHHSLIITALSSWLSPFLSMYIRKIGIWSLISLLQ